jgi:hypothetical protein
MPTPHWPSASTVELEDWGTVKHSRKIAPRKP